MRNTVTNETSAKPIISAAAVAAVRDWFRCEFSRASRPSAAQPLERSADHPRELRHESRL